MPEESYNTTENEYEYGKGNAHSLMDIKPQDKIDLFCIQKGGWCEAVVRETRRSTRAEYLERQRLHIEKEKREKERRLKQKIAKQRRQQPQEDGGVVAVDVLANETSDDQTQERSESSHAVSSSTNAVETGVLPDDAGANSAYVDLGSDIIFEAKCHYLGWQARYDEWVVFPSKRVAVHHLHTAVTKREKLLREKKSKTDENRL